MCQAESALLASIVWCFNSETCQLTEDMAPVTIEGCCLNNPDGLTFQRFGGGTCESCIGSYIYMCMEYTN